MARSSPQLKQDALAIWHAGVEAVRSDRLVREAIHLEEDWLVIGDEEIPLADLGRIVVVGGGKAGAGMALGCEQALGPKFLADQQVTGWLNVPEDCLPNDPATAPQRIHLHGARPAGMNEPTAAGVQGSDQILKLVSDLGPRDLCLCLLSGGGSALLPAPVPEITLADKQTVTKFLSAAGANIRELNTVRKQLSRIKGGGLARACRAGRLVSLIISDVLGDPLEIIASGPTVLNSATPRDALHILEHFGAARDAHLAGVMSYLRQKPVAVASSVDCAVTNLIIGNNAVAVDAAGIVAEQLGYSHAMHSAKDEPTADEVGRHMADLALQMLQEPGPNALISGGEPVVKLIAAAQRGRGGRNQQLVLAALTVLQQANGGTDVVLLSGGTDGEDGPTDAAGAICTPELIAAMQTRGLDPADYLRRNDAYTFFQQLDGLIQTGPTHTNVCDLRVLLVARDE